MPTGKDGIRQYFRKWKDKVVGVAVEGGGYTRWIYDRLAKMGIRVYVVNPLKVKLIAETKKETDKQNGRANSISKVGHLEGEPEWEDG